MNTTASKLDAPFLKIREAAQKTGLSQYYLRMGCRDGSIPCTRSGSTYFVNVPALLRKLGAVDAEAIEGR